MSACEKLLNELDGAGDQSAISSSLTCLAHRSLTDDPADVLTRWPGCKCGMYGHLLDRVCVEGGSGRPFGDAPIDARLPEALVEAAARAQDVMAKREWTLDSLGLLGCHIVRFERGGNVLGLPAQPSPQLHATDVSSHSAGLACDLRFAWVDRGVEAEAAGYSVEMAFWTLADPGGMRDVNDRRRLFGDLSGRVQRAGGEGAYFRAIEATPPASDRRSGSVYTFSVIRNALVDAGFIVYTPATNVAHYNHLHFQLPDTTAAWTEMANDSTTVPRREAIVAAALARAR